MSLSSTFWKVCQNQYHPFPLDDTRVVLSSKQCSQLVASTLSPSAIYTSNTVFEVIIYKLEHICQHHHFSNIGLIDKITSPKVSESILTHLPSAPGLQKNTENFKPVSICRCMPSLISKDLLSTDRPQKATKIKQLLLPPSIYCLYATLSSKRPSTVKQKPSKFSVQL